MDGQGFKRLRIALTATVAAGLVPGVADDAAAADVQEGHQITTASNITVNGAPYDGSAVYPSTAQLNGTIRAMGFFPFVNPEFTKEIAYAARGLQQNFDDCNHVTGANFSCTDNQRETTAPFEAFSFVSIKDKRYTNPGGTIDVTGDTVQTNNTKLSGIKTNLRYEVMGNGLVRLLVTMKNPTTNVVKKPVSLETRLTRSATTVVTTSDNDAIVENTDAYILTDPASEQSALFARGDAANGVVSLDLVSSPRRYNDVYQIKFGKRKTVRLLYFMKMGTTAELQAVDQNFSNGSTLRTNGLLTGLTDAELGQVANWTGLVP
jgi:hypothetical protein